MDGAAAAERNRKELLAILDITRSERQTPLSSPQTPLCEILDKSE